MGRLSSTILGHVFCWILDLKHSMTEITLVLIANQTPHIARGNLYMDLAVLCLGLT